MDRLRFAETIGQAESALEVRVSSSLREEKGELVPLVANLVLFSRQIGENSVGRGLMWRRVMFGALVR